MLNKDELFLDQIHKELEQAKIFWQFENNLYVFDSIHYKLTRFKNSWLVRVNKSFLNKIDLEKLQKANIKIEEESNLFLHFEVQTQEQLNVVGDIFNMKKSNVKSISSEEIDTILSAAHEIIQQINQIKYK